MPELPEVETVRLGLARLLPDREIVDVRYDNAKSFPNDKKLVESVLLGATIMRINRRGKALIIELSSGNALLIHLKMTGQLVFRQSQGESFGAGHPNDSLIGELPDKSTRVIFTFKDGSHLFFNDQRKFGWVKLLPISDIKDESFIAKLGPEALAGDFTFEDFRTRLKRRSRTSIKAAILDQTVLAGVGNIYADESLFMARIHPATLVEKVSIVKLKRLYRALREVMQLSIKLGGSSDRNYVDAEGRKGSYLKFAQVFRRDNQPCPRCERTIEKIRVAGRGTHYCPHCQKGGRK
jgi:formamidopyrimidine-DNA glycosylase